MKKAISRILLGVLLLAVLTAILSVTFLNKQFASTRMTTLMRDGRLASGQRDYYSAIDCYIKAITLNRRSVPAYLALAEACVYAGEIEDALYYLELGIKHTGNEKLREAYNNLLGTLPSPPPEEEPPSEEDLTSPEEPSPEFSEDAVPASEEVSPAEADVSPSEEDASPADESVSPSEGDVSPADESVSPEDANPSGEPEATPPEIPEETVSPDGSL